MDARDPILGDHRRVKSKLVTPFNDMFDERHDVSWINTMIPELLWIGLLHQALGDRRAVEIVTGLTRDVRSSSAVASQRIWAAAGTYGDLPEAVLSDIVAARADDYGDDLRTVLAPLSAWYPDHPMSAIHREGPPPAETSDLLRLKRLVSTLFDRSDRTSTMVQATATWLAFDAGVLKVAPGLALAQFPRIEEYPSTEASIRVAASMRATLNMFFCDDRLMPSSGTWAHAFWNRGLELEPCG